MIDVSEEALQLLDMHGRLALQLVLDRITVAVRASDEDAITAADRLLREIERAMIAAYPAKPRPSARVQVRPAYFGVGRARHGYTKAGRA